MADAPVVLGLGAAGGGSSGTAVGGDLSGTVGSATVAKINGATLGTTTATNKNVLVANGSQWASVAVSGDVNITNTGAASVLRVNGTALGSTAATAGTFLAGNGATIASLTLSGDATVDGSGVASLKATGTAGTYQSVTTDAQGRVTAGGNLTGDVTTSGSAATTVAQINGVALGSTTATSGTLLIGSGSQWVTHALSGDLTITNAGVGTLKNTGTAGTYQSVTTDAQGRVTAGTALTTAMLPTVFRVLGADCTQHSTTSASEVVLTTLAVSAAVGATITANSIIWIETAWSMTGSTNQKILRCRIGTTGSGTGGTQFMNISDTTASVVAHYRTCKMFVRSTTSQLFTNTGNFASENTSTSAAGTAAINLANGFDLTICGAVAAGDTVSIESVAAYCFTP
jgi:hypothetical protein